MPAYNSLIYEGVLDGAANVFSSPIWLGDLASASAVRFFAVATLISGTPTLTVELQESPDTGDDRFWVGRSGTPEINGVSLTGGSVNVIKGADSGLVPTSAFGRARIALGGGTPKAHVKIWATGRRADWSQGRPGSYVVYHRKVFDDYVEGVGPVYSNPSFNDLLGTADAYRLFAITENVNGSPAPTLTVQVEESPDQINWRNKSSPAEINGVTLNVGTFTPARGADNGTTPSSSFVRARIQLGAGGGAPEGRVQLWVTGRGEIQG